PFALAAREPLEHAPPELFGARAIVRRGNVASRGDRVAVLAFGLGVSRAVWLRLPRRAALVRFGIARAAGPRLLEQPLRFLAALHAALAVLRGKLPCRLPHHAASPAEPFGDFLRQRSFLLALLAGKVHRLLGELALHVTRLLESAPGAGVGFLPL